MPLEALARNESAFPSSALPLTSREIIDLGRRVLLSEAKAIIRLSQRLDRSFSLAAQRVDDTRGCVIVTGIGKAGLVGQKIAATLSSLDKPAHFVHPAEAMHGDLGRIGPQDVVLLLTYSGETPEVTELLPALAARGAPMIAITKSSRSTVGSAAEITVELGPIVEACLLGLAPSSSTTAMLALGDALALSVSRLAGLQPEEFARHHPGGSLGRRLSRVDDHMRPLDECRIAPASASVRQVLVTCSKPGRRSGAIMLTDDRGQLAGIFTDSDLARLFEQHREAALDDAISTVMTTMPHATKSGTLLGDAVREMAGHKISELPVVDHLGRPVGMLDMTDLVEAGEYLAESGQVDHLHQETSPHVRLFPNQDGHAAHNYG